ncbi:hypothetical protein [Devosia epidermidihirudinis]|uniref:hypothetical protein n=1 Tax=Devosia epidermidihirudinis TaxID=1293439 RepID=UPI0006978621|nr:hypothetical protein [Devosia epidermidihirudinis]
MRIVLALVLALFATPGFAQGWEPYGNARFGYIIDVPPGFVGSGESDNGDGQSFYNAKGAQGLLVWGGNLLEDFDTAVTSAMDYAVAENGYNVTYQATTPRWASFSGLNGSRILYQRMILLCDGTSYAAFRVEYSTINAADMKPVVEQLVTSLRDAGC